MNMPPSTPPKDLDTLPDGLAVLSDDDELLFSHSSTETTPVFETPSRPTPPLPLFARGHAPVAPGSFSEETTRKAHAPRPERKALDTPSEDDDPWSSQ